MTINISKHFNLRRLVLYNEEQAHIVHAQMKDFKLQANSMVKAGSDEGENDLGVALETRPETKRPPFYKVLILNDDYTPMEFVIMVLERFFGLTHQESFDLMLTVHKKGLAVVGVFSHEIAETKVTQVIDIAQRHGHPLQCTLEKE